MAESYIRLKMTSLPLSFLGLDAYRLNSSPEQ